MLSLLTRRKRMTGGLYFGPPAWFPTAIEDNLPAPATPDAPLPHPPTTPAALAQLLTQLHITKTSHITPALVDQVQLVGHRKIKTLILNLLPTQPEFALPAALARLALPEIAAALRLLQNVLKPRRTLVVLDRHDHRTRRVLRRYRKISESSRTPPGQKLSFDIKSLRNQYPQAHPTILLRSLFGKRLPVNRLPIRLSHILVDPLACWALGRHLLTSQPFDRRPVQLFVQSNDPKETPRLVMAPLAEPPESITSLLQTYHLPLPENPQVILNGMLTGQLVDPLPTHITPATESLALRETPQEEPPTPCFACGWCVDVCPTSLNPVSLFQLALQAQNALPAGPESPLIARELRSSHAREALHCIGCGLCSYVCPTRLPLTQQTLRLRHYVDAKQNP